MILFNKGHISAAVKGAAKICQPAKRCSITQRTAASTTSLAAANEVVLAAVRWVMEQRFAGWQIFAAPLTAALMWPLLNKIMLYFTNYKRLHR